jgi:hypothetical protein
VAAGAAEPGLVHQVGIDGGGGIESSSQGIQRRQELKPPNAALPFTRSSSHGLGDDRTDEDLFGALPDGSVAVHVGPSASRAPLRIRDVPAARALLARIAEERPAAAAGESDGSHGQSTLMIAPRGAGASSRGSRVGQRPAR